jgi:penicillin amidase
MEFRGIIPDHAARNSFDANPARWYNSPDPNPIHREDMRMKTLGRVLGTFGIILLALVVLIGVFLGYTITRSFPQTSGVVRLAGLQSSVEIIRDANGIPHLYADSVHDLFMAQGYVHAQERFYQMDFWRHQTAGRLSELYGRSLVDTDKFLRTVGWRRVAEQEYAGADPQTRAVLDAYAAGVNAYLHSRPAADVSLEYSILGLIGLKNYQPEDWTGADTLAWGKAMAWDLGGNFRDEIRTARLIQLLGAEKARDLTPSVPADHPVIVPDPSTSLRTNPAFSAINFDSLSRRVNEVNQAIGGYFDGIGSNNWVIHGSRTTTGQPMLANDPHLGIQMPSIWFQNGLHCRVVNSSCPYDVVGYSFAGVPAVIIGHNARIAWGVTNLGPDVQDLFMEKINPANPNQYEVNGQWVDMTVMQETIRIRGGGEESVTIRYTRNGPVISEVFGAAQRLITETVTVDETALGPGYALSLRWTALEPGRLFEAVFRINRAQNWDEFREALRDWDVPAQNFVYADVDGNIGYQAPGHIPIRANGDGALPAPGWNDDYQWTGYIPFDELPYAFNPPQGFIATANQPVVGPEYKYVLNANGFDMGYRAARINEMLLAQPKISMGYIAQIQGDNQNLGAAEVLPYLFNLTFDDPKEQAAVESLRGWDLQMHMDSQPAAIYASFLRALLNNVFRPQTPEGYWPTGGSSNWVMLRNLLPNLRSEWWAASGGRDEALRRALADGLAALEKDYGADMASWRWGRMHTSSFENATVGQSGIAPIDALFNRGPFYTSGGSSIVNATGFNLANDDSPYAVTSVPSMRMIVDLSDFDNMWTIHTTGQSGHALHPHYIDFADRWRHLQYNLMPFSRAAVDEAAEDVLVLTP